MLFTVHKTTVIKPVLSTARTFDSTDPRRPLEAVDFTLPDSLSTASPFDVSTIAMICSGLSMLTRRPEFVWIAAGACVSSAMGKSNFIVDTNTFNSAYSSVLFVLTAAFAVYLPILSGIGRLN